MEKKLSRIQTILKLMKMYLLVLKNSPNKPILKKMKLMMTTLKLMYHLV